MVNAYHRTIDKVDSTMNAMNEQRELANEIADSLANPLNAGIDLDEVRVSCLAGLLCLVLIISALSSLSVPAHNMLSVANIAAIPTATSHVTPSRRRVNLSLIVTLFACGRTTCRRSWRMN